MKYKLINQTTGDQHFCDKITLDGFDYYVNKEEIIHGDHFITDDNRIEVSAIDWNAREWHKKVIATNNCNANIPQILKEVDILAFKYYQETKKQYYSNGQKTQLPKSNKEFQAMSDGFIDGYNKAIETHPFTAEDADAYVDAVMGGCLLRAKEWKEQQPITIYYQ